MSRLPATRNGSTEVEIVTEDGEILDVSRQPTALEAITKAEVDIQISTAKRFPRNLTKFMAEAKTMVAIDSDLAAQCTYWLPARRGSTDQISGPSVRLAEIVAACYGNLRIVGRIIADDGKQITAQGVAIDLERNVGYSTEVKRGVVTRDGRRFGDDMIKTTCNAAISIATRNATFKVVPRAFVNVIEEESLKVARGDVKSLGVRTDAALDWFRGKGAQEADVFRVLGVAGREDMTLDLLGKLNGMRTAVKDGQATIAELFAAPTLPPPEGKPAATKSDALAAKLGREPGVEG